MTKEEMQKSVETALMFYWNYGRVDMGDIENWSESTFNTTMSMLVKSYE